MATPNKEKNNDTEMKLMNTRDGETKNNLTKSREDFMRDNKGYQDLLKKEKETAENQKKAA